MITSTVTPLVPIEKIQTYINCDLRYFNLEDIVQNVGHFDGIYFLKLLS